MPLHLLIAFYACFYFSIGSIYAKEKRTTKEEASSKKNSANVECNQRKILAKFFLVAPLSHYLFIHFAFYVS